MIYCTVGTSSNQLVYGTWALAGITLLLALVTVITPIVRKNWNRPILAVDFNPDSTADRLATRGTDIYRRPGRDLFYLKFRVINVGRTAAVDIRALLEKIERLDTHEPIDTYIPLPLWWADTPPETTFLPRINNGDYAWCNLGYAQKSMETVIPQRCIFTVDTIIKLRGGRSIIAAGTYRMTVNIAPANAKPCRAIFEVQVPDLWSANREEMFTDSGLSLVIRGQDPEYKIPRKELRQLKRKYG